MYESGGLLIDGAWRGASDGECIVVRSPATGEPVGSVPAATEADEAAALAAAERGFARWSKTPAWERAVVLRRAADLLRARNDTYALLMSGETGKPLLEARGEINASAD